MLNNWTGQGRFCRDPEIRFTQSGTKVAVFTLAIDRDGKAADGVRKADFVDCVAWDKTADFVSDHFFKGDLAVVQGRLEVRDWTDKDGKKRRSTEVSCSKVYFGGNKPKAREEPREFTPLDDEEDELPF